MCRKVNRVVIGVLFIVLTLSLWAGESNEYKRKTKFQVDLFGGFSSLDPGDLNSIPLLFDRNAAFWYQERYDYYQQIGYIQSLSQGREGEFKTIKYGLPWGLRLKYYLSRRWSVSLGAKYLSRSITSNVSVQNQYNEADGAPGGYTRQYSRFTLSAAGFIPFLGVHWEQTLSDKMGLEIFVNSGPLFGTIKYRNEVRNVQTTGATENTTGWVVIEEGKGTGFALDGGIRLNVFLGPRFSVFFETGYAWQIVSRVNGPGREEYEGETDTWDGQWGMKDYYAADSWGVMDTEYASNYFISGAERLWLRAFKLDLSGFQARLGIAYRF
jgi:hypothetical protein